MTFADRFFNRAKNYTQYRPHYPSAILAFLRQKIGLNESWIIADIGSGTGISSEPFVNNQNKVFGIEPNAEMRQVAEKDFTGHPNFISRNATAEKTTLPDSLVDLIVAGQAFHWFDEEKCKKEFQRVLKSGGYLILMWNIRKLDSPFQQEYEKLLLELGIDYDQVRCSNVNEEAIKAFYSPHHYDLKTFSHSQFFDFIGLKGRLLSCSYAPLEPHPNYQPMMKRLRELFEKYQVNSQIEFAYDCQLYYGRIK